MYEVFLLVIWLTNLYYTYPSAEIISVNVSCIITWNIIRRTISVFSIFQTPAHGAPPHRYIFRRLRLQGPPKRWYPTKSLHGVTTTTQQHELQSLVSMIQSFAVIFIFSRHVFITLYFFSVIHDDNRHWHWISYLLETNWMYKPNYLNILRIFHNISSRIRPITDASQKFVIL